jgi:hypothetical protein
VLTGHRAGVGATEDGLELSAWIRHRP